MKKRETGLLQGAPATLLWPGYSLMLKIQRLRGFPLRLHGTSKGSIAGSSAETICDSIYSICKAGVGGHPQGSPGVYLSAPEVRSYLFIFPSCEKILKILPQ